MATRTYISSDPNIPSTDTGSLVQPGRHLEFFETVEELAGTLEVPERPSITAGYADIYRGFWTDPQGVRVQVAIKELRTLIPKDRQTEEEALKTKADTRLKREVFVWSQTKHPNLHPLLGYCLEPKPRLISPWCHHGNLKDYLQANSSLTRGDKLRLTYQTACGLEHLHSQVPPICHADIKPENVLINDYHEATLSDFGLSRVVHDLEARSGFTTSETIKGTLRYMASELSAGQKPNLASDVYAFGGLILTVMSGKPPFEGLLHHVILRRVMQDQPPIPKDHPKLQAHDPLWKLMRLCWNDDSTARPTMRDVLPELLRQINHEESSIGSRFDIASVIDNRANEYRERDLDIPGVLQHGGDLPLLTANLVSPGYSRSGVPVARRERNASPGELLLATRETLKSVQLRSKVIPVIGKYIGAAAEVGLSMVEIVKAMNKSENLSDSLELNPWRLAELLQDLVEQSRQHLSSNIRSRVHDIQRELEFAQGKIKERYSSNLFRDELASLDQPRQKRCQGTVQKLLEEIQLLVNLDTTCVTNELKTPEILEQHRHLLNRLGDGKYGAQGNAIDDIVCLPGTRVEILERIDSWIRDTSTPDRVLWIRGMAGRGKSTIASTVVHNWQYRASCAIFHFRRGQTALNTRIVCAVARQLGGSLIPEVRNAVLESVQENEDIADQRLDVQFETLLVVPLSKPIYQRRTILIVVDALDECQNPKDAVDFVKLIDQHSSSFPANVKFLLTCRPEAQLLRALEPRKWLIEDLDSSINVANDLARFVKQGCTQIREDHGLPDDWPASGDIRNLVEMSQGLFQWAQTVITYIGNGSPANRLRELLKRPSTWNGLDDLYHQILSKAFDNATPNTPKQDVLYRILGTLVVAPYPVCLEVIAALYGDNSIFEGVDQQGVIEYLRQDILADLNSLLHIPTSPIKPIRFMHTSIRDLLVNAQRCGERVYFVDVRQHHQRLASLCLRIMIQCLKDNICNLSDLSKPNSEVQDVVKQEVSTAICYSCRAWSIHLTEGTEWPRLVTEGPDGQRADFEKFSKEKLLNWLEVMSLIGATPEAAHVAKHVYSWISQSHDGANFDSKSLIRLWNDARWFIIVFSEPISFGAPHIYTSALLHCPRETQLWQCYGGHAKIRILHGGIQPLTWPANLWTRPVGACVLTIAFTPDGVVLASGSSDGTIRLWDAQTGMRFGQPLIGHSGAVATIGFSPDGKLLVSGSSDRTIRLWNAQTGSPIGQPLTGHNGPVLSVAFSPDGKVLASGSDDGTIILWNPQTRSSLGEPLTGQRFAVAAVASSPVAWNAQTGSSFGQPPTGHKGPVLSVAFSPDGKVLASGSSDGTIRLWNPQTRSALRHSPTGHSAAVRSVAFSPDGRFLASGSSDGKIRLWNCQSSSAFSWPLTNSSGRVRSIAFSPDGRFLASGSSDGTIQLWNPQTSLAFDKSLTGHSAGVCSVAYSPDGKFLASGSDDGTIRLWDPQSGSTFDRPLTSYSNRVRSIAFMPDGKALASGSIDGTVRLWDPQTTSAFDQPLIGHGLAAATIAFSPDGKVLASRFDDGTIRFWNTQTSAPFGHPFTGYSDGVCSVAFSPDGKFLASGSWDGRVRLWDAHTCSPSGQSLTVHRSCISSVAFSPDGRVLASGSRDGGIRFCHTHSQTPLGQSLTGHLDWVRSLAFSPDGKVLASGSDDGTIRLWDAQMGSCLGQRLTNPKDPVYSVAFSPDGKVLASGSSAGRIRLWDAYSGAPLGQQVGGWNNMLAFVPFSHAAIIRYGVPNIRNHWVRLSASRLLWLPSEYLANGAPTILFSNGTLAIISDSTFSIFEIYGAFRV